jgi:hypothetical protein
MRGRPAAPPKYLLGHATDVVSFCILRVKSNDLFIVVTYTPQDKLRKVWTPAMSEAVLRIGILASSAGPTKTLDYPDPTYKGCASISA